MTASLAAQQYLGTQVEASTPVERVVLLYDASLRWLGTAREAMAARNIPARREALSRTMGIIGELQQSLDMERGGATAEELDRLHVLARIAAGEAFPARENLLDDDTAS